MTQSEEVVLLVVVRLGFVGQLFAIQLSDGLLFATVVAFEVVADFVDRLLLL